MSGFFITLEGIEGVGKSTQMKLLAENLNKRNYSTLTTYQPGATDIGDKIRRLLLDPAQGKMSSRSEIFLFAADRAQHVEEIIKPALARGKIVISDRYYDSNFAYQGYGRRLDMEMVKKLNFWAVNGCHPDLTILLDLAPEVGLKRASSLSRNGTGDRLEREELSFYRRVRAGYLHLAREFERFVVVDADQKIELIQQRILKIVEESLP